MNERLNMNAYYYHFDETGLYAIDKILSAVADAGHGCHNTEDWMEYGYPDKIQKAAEEATEIITKALDWACYQNCHSKRMNYGTCNQKDCPVALANNREFIGSSRTMGEPMTEREKVYDLISEYAIQYREWMNKGVKLPRLDREEVVDQIDALYSDREKAMREALEWACKNKCNYDTEYDDSCCTICPIKQALEGK